MTQVGQPGHQNKIALQLLKAVSYIVCASVACEFDLQQANKGVETWLSDLTKLQFA